MVNCLDTVWIPDLTVTVTAQVQVVVGLPLMVPDVEIVKPFGRPVADQAYVPVPPVAARVAEYA